MDYWRQHFRPSGGQGFYSEWIFTIGSEDLATEQKVDGYLAHKWGLSARLPESHPYKKTAPAVLWRSPRWMPPSTMPKATHSPTLEPWYPAPQP
jgi:hypothetical protein